MASGSTAKLGLSQWAASDHVLRSDFNSDNQKIENAISGRGIILLSSLTTTSPCTQLQLNVSGISWAEYSEVILDINLTTTGITTCFLRANGASSYCSHFRLSGDGSNSNGFAVVSTNSPSTLKGSSRCVIYSLYDSNNYVSAYTVPAGDCPNWGTHSAARLSAVSSIYFLLYEGSYSILAGSEIKIWGVK